MEFRKKVAIRKGGPFAVVAHILKCQPHFQVTLDFMPIPKGGTLTKISDFFLQKNLSDFFPQNIDQIHQNLS